MTRDDRARLPPRLAFLYVALVGLTLACDSRPSAGAPPAESLPTTTGTPPSGDEAPLAYRELITGGARPTDELAMIIAVHGLGDSPDGFSRAVQGLAEKARVLVPAAPDRYGRGFTWFPYRPGRTDAELAEGIGGAAERVASFIRWATQARPTRGKPIITGFSQGGMVSFAIAAGHPSLVSAAYPVSGLLPRPLWPKPNAPLPPIVAFHGEADTVVPFDAARATVEHLRGVSSDVVLRSYPGVGHAIPGPMRVAWHAALGDAIARLAP